MLSKKLMTFVSAVLAMGLLAGCNSGGSQSTKPSGETSTTTSTSTSATDSGSGSGTGSDTGSSTDTGSSSGTTVTHTVTFYDQGRVYGDPVTVNDGATVAKPATDPTKDGDEFVNYVFDNWYLSGATAAYDFATPVTDDLDLYSKYNEVAKEYDLVVYVYGVNGASSPTTYITEAESNRILAEFKKQDGVDASAKILWHYVEGLTNTNFNKAVNESKVPVDLVISGAKLNNDDDVIECDATNGKVKVGEGWFENTTRYLAVTAACAASHRDLAVKLYSLVKGVGPDYAITLSNTSLTLEIDGTAELTATYYGAAPTWELKELSPAGCFTFENGVVTAVAAGTGKIVATDAANHTAECLVTVSAAPVVPAHDLVLAINISNANSAWMTEADAQSLVARFTSAGQPGEGKDVELHVISGVAIQGVVDEIAAIKSTNELAKVDAVLCRSAFMTNSASKDLISSEYTPVDVHTTWKYSGGQFALLKDAFADHVALAEAFGTFVSAQNVDYFEFDTTAITVKVDATYQVETELTGLTYTSSNTDVFTVSDTGLITGVAAGNAKLKVAKNAYYVEIGVTVESAVVEPVTLHFYVCVSATSTTYITDEELTAFETFIESKIPATTTIVWHKVTGKTNAQFVTYIKGLEEETADLVIAGSGALGSGDSKLNPHADMTSKRLSETYSSGGQRNFIGLANMPASHVSAALQVYNNIPVYSA